MVVFCFFFFFGTIFFKKLTVRSRNTFFDSILEEKLVFATNSCLDSPIPNPVLFRLQLRFLLLRTDWFTSNVSVFNSVSLRHYFDQTLNVSDSPNLLAFWLKTSVF